MSEMEYKKIGDYYYPDVYLEPAPRQGHYPPLGKYGLLRRTFLKEHRSGLYNEMIMKNEITEHLHQVDEEAREMVDRLVEEMAPGAGLTEELKARDQMAWVQLKYNLFQAAEEIVMPQIVYA